MVNRNPHSVNYLSKNLKYLIKRFDTSQSQLALYMDKRQTSISNWINKVSEPGVSDLLAMHHFFGISLDALVTTDLENSKIVMDSHVADFKRNGKISCKDYGKIQPVSEGYFAGVQREESTVNDTDPVAAWAIMGQFKQISEKIDQLQLSVDSIAKKQP